MNPILSQIGARSTRMPTGSVLGELGGHGGLVLELRSDAPAKFAPSLSSVRRPPPAHFPATHLPSPRLSKRASYASCASLKTVEGNLGELPSINFHLAAQTWT